MLYFSKLRIILVSLTTLFFIFIASTNFQDSENSFISKKINLGLDLQGGSYLLLEIDTKKLIQERIQNKVVTIKKILREQNIEYTNFLI